MKAVVVLGFFCVDVFLQIKIPNVQLKWASESVLNSYSKRILKATRILKVK